MSATNGVGRFTVHSVLNDVPKRPLVFIIQGRYQNWIKPLMLLTELGIDHDVLCLPSTRTEWFKTIHPQQMAPAMVDELHEKRVPIWDSSSCLLYICTKYDKERKWVGRTLEEEIEVWNWLVFETSALGPSAKYWVTYDLAKEQIPAVNARLLEDIKKQYDILERRLSEPGQQYLALKDRPTIADIANLLFADYDTSKRMGLDISNWPKLEAWGKKLHALPGIKKVFAEKDEWKQEPLPEREGELNGKPILVEAKTNGVNGTNGVKA